MSTLTHARRGDITRLLRRAGLPVADVRALRGSTPAGLAATLEHGLDVRQVHDVVRVIHTAWTAMTPDTVQQVRDAINLVADAGYTLVIVNEERVYFGTGNRATKAENHAHAAANVAAWGMTEADLKNSFVDWYITVPVSFTVALDEVQA